MPAFFSDKGKLMLPERAHSDDDRYEKVEIGKPLCVEIEHVGFGDIKDWWGRAEVIVSSWAKVGRNPKPAPRLINMMRTGIEQYSHLGDLGAAQYGTRLVYYTPSYNGAPLRMTLELVESDKLRSSQIDSLAKALRELAKLAIFAPQLAYLSLAPEVVKLAGRLYNLLNASDLVLFSDLDLSFNEPFRKVLTSGRFVLVKENVNATEFIKNFKLGADSNVLQGSNGMPAEQAGFTGAYTVIKVDALERSEYKDFEADSDAQAKIKEFLDEKVDLTEDLAEGIATLVKGVRSFDSVKGVLKLHSALQDAGTDEKREKIGKDIDAELKKLSDDDSSLLKEALEL